MEGDVVRIAHSLQAVISIHSLRMEGDVGKDVAAVLGYAFQSTPSAWRETALSIITMFCRRDFNPLPPHGGRPIS